AARADIDAALRLEVGAVRHLGSGVERDDVDRDAARDRGAGAARAFLLRAGAGDAPGDNVVRLARWRHRLDRDAVAGDHRRVADARGVVDQANVDRDAGGDAGAVAAAAAAATPTSAT